ncbi:hypothetical protein [Mesorhizobium sp. LSHC412B00]|uniref:hypothetical protein n=1 Tax=Mesorhizobium sp. LSHC412B00 TaxID=1287285 RepID=UPI0003CE4A6B|nr:hypothetical protein [Mesorhizobium sp. LSHC412B00]ESX83474.1 hypothetical protein X756_29935 [Mesorhizobium sp. LSHC412B00]
MEATLFWNLLNLVGFGLSIYAAWAATSAKQAAKKAAEAVVEKKNQLEDGDRLKDLLAVLNAAKDAAMRRQGGAPEFLSAGHDPARDLHALRTAHDRLITRLPIKLGQSLRADAKNAAGELQKAIKTIEEIGVNRDGWKDALATLQILIPSLEQEDRRRSDRELLEHVID